MKIKFIFFLALFFISFVSANQFGYNSLVEPEGNVTINKNLSYYYYNASGNTTQFTTAGDTLTLLTTWFLDEWNSIFRNFFNQNLNTTATPTFNNLTLTSGYINNGSDWLLLGNLNNAENISWNEDYANTKYLKNSTFNASYHSFNNTLNIQQLYNTTSSMIANSFQTITNASMSLYNNTLLNNAPFNKSATDVYLNVPTNKVGIGTTSPTSLLHLSSATPILTLTDTDTGAGTQISASSIAGALNIYADTNNEVANSYLALHLDGNEYFRINTGGNVGIGTTSPAYKLEVANSAIALNVSGFLYVNRSNVGIGTGTFNSVVPLEIVRDNLIPASPLMDRAIVLAEYYGVRDNYGGKGFSLMTAQGTKATPLAVDKTTIGNIMATYFFDGTKWRYGSSINVGVDEVADNQNIATSLRFSTGNVTGDASAGSVTGATEQMRITSAGNVGIGTTSPTEKLNVVGNANFTGNLTGNTFYSGFYKHNDSGDVMNFAVENVSYNFTGICGESNGLSCGSDGRINVSVGGLYRVSYVASGVGQNNHLYHMHVAINGVVMNRTASHMQASAGEVITMVGIGHIRLSPNDYLNLRILDSTGTSTGIAYSSNINLERIAN